LAGFRFLHCADIHLDSPLRGLSAYPGAPVEAVRGATRRALVNLIALAEEERVDFVVIAGDIFDGDWKDFHTGLFFTQQMARLGRVGIRVVLVLGNHDAANVITKTLPQPATVIQLSAKRPESVGIDGHDVVIHGQSFATRAVTDNLAAAYPAARAGAFNIGLLHTALAGRDGHEPYAPCRVEQLLNHGYQYWALGHVHAREVVAEAPFVVFPGNLQGRNIRECGAKGATLVTVRDGAVAAIQHRPLDVLRWVRIDVDVSACAQRDEVQGQVRQALEAAADQADGRPLAARVRLVGNSAAHAALAADRAALREEVRAVAAEAGGELWVEKVELATLPVIDRQSLRGRDDALAELLAIIDQAATEPQAGEQLKAEIEPLLTRLPAELRAGLPDLGDPAQRAACLAEIEDMLLAALGGTGGGR